MVLYGGMRLMKTDKTKSQTDAIIQYLRRNKSITSLQALNYLMQLDFQASFMY